METSAAAAPTAVSAVVRLPNQATSVRTARAFAVGVLHAWGHHGESVDEVSLLVSEIVGNAVRHVGRGEVVVTVADQESSIIVTVHDQSPVLPARSTPALVKDIPEQGRGLWIMQSLAERWGAHPDASGKLVWFQVAL